MKKIKNIVIKVILIVLAVYCANGAVAQSNNQDIYFFNQRYNVATIDFLKSKNFKRVDIITNSSLVNSKGNLDFDNISKNLNKIIKSDTKLLVIDWEKDDFWNLKNKRGTASFKNSEKEFITLVKFIKTKYPNLNVGIYGLPFKVFYNKAAAYNEDKKFDNILRTVDVICPSLYFDFLDKEKGADVNKLFLKNQLEVALDYGKRLNKKVLPFVWEIVHPSNKNYGGQLVPISEFKSKVNYICDFKHLNSSVSGFIWWAPGNATLGHFQKKSRSFSQNKRNQYDANVNRNGVTIDYVKSLKL